MRGTSIWLVISAVPLWAFAPTRVTPIKSGTGLSRVSRGSLLFAMAGTPPAVVIVSPPGGVGEVAAVKSAEMGCRVRWFVVSPPVMDEEGDNLQQTVATLKLSPQAMLSFKSAGGSLELAGSEADKLLLSTDNPESTLSSVAQWTGAADALICTYDTGIKTPRQASNKERDIQRQETWKDAIKVAAKEAAQSISQSGNKVAILPAFDEEDSKVATESGAGIAGLVTGIISGKKPSIPATLSDALCDPGTSSFFRLRYGTLFGLPESSPDFTPLIGGPKKDAELCEEYSMRAVRVDPSLSVTGNVMLGSTTRSSRLAVGEAAVLMALGKVPVFSDLDLCISSQRGLEPMSTDQWKDEFARARDMLSSGQGARLFSTDFAGVPSIARLTDWLATKWAPSVLRTYEIATIRAGERPVFATRDGDDKVEIIWQQLVDFKSVTVGRLTIEVKNDGLTALRGPGDASEGFGSISTRPLNGEDVIVRFLAEAAFQAVEKGLAKKAKTKKSVDVAPTTTSPPSETVAVAGVASVPSTGFDQAPRSAGARRSTERPRGTQRKRKDGEVSP